MLTEQELRDAIKGKYIANIAIRNGLCPECGSKLDIEIKIEYPNKKLSLIELIFIGRYWERVSYRKCSASPYHYTERIVIIDSDSFGDCC